MERSLLCGVLVVWWVKNVYSITVAHCHNHTDCTDELQQALNASDELIIPNIHRPWIIRPVFIYRSNQIITLERGTWLLAKNDSFHRNGDHLVSCGNWGYSVKNVTFQGPKNDPSSVVLQMRKKDYTIRPWYKFSEWRHAFSIFNASNVTLRDVTLKESGGDGIEVTFTKDILIERVISDGNYRQGMSIISTKGVVITDSIFRFTNGTAPMAGVDIEPDKPTYSLGNILFRNCSFHDNSGNGLTMFLKQQSPTISIPANITAIGCKMYNNHQVGIRIGTDPTTPPSFPAGRIVIEQTMVWNNSQSAIRVDDHPPEPPYAHVLFKDIVVHNPTTTSQPTVAPVFVQTCRKPKFQQQPSGGVTFLNVTVHDNVDRPFFSLVHGGALCQAKDIVGTFNVFNPYGCTADIGLTPQLRNLSIEYSCTAKGVDTN